MSDRKKTKEEFLSGKQRYRGPNRVVFLVFLIVAVVGVGWFAFMARDSAQLPKRYEGGNYNIGETPQYKGQTISMTDITSEVKDGKIVIPLDKIIESNIIYTQYNAGGEAKAITAFITPSGHLSANMAMCEPCRSERFHIQDNVLVCDTCGTRWYLNDLNGISGGCVKYPPEDLPYEVKDGQVLIPADIVEEWQPRI
ncbi:DUF2318 domain-containing protein [Metallumcola ferriviriculae]|uniref:DUF2318 domain-containing protein n=1 Tax=Metallumcola ferriviriculae TaxID=3039180 RepID=A0AAU0UJM2_9FIRM|nr:DUF2318 domain-containing protein [Desulfitibacteraceae bacterium MK1]